MVFHLPISVRKYGEFGVCLSQTIHITAAGAEPITTTPATLAVIDA
jgi:Xaa-Pro dipeptidase